MNRTLSTLFFSVLIFSSTALYSAAVNNENNIETSSEKVQDAYFFSLLQFIQNHVRGEDTVTLRNWQGEERDVEGINKFWLAYITEDALTAATLLRANQMHKNLPEEVRIYNNLLHQPLLPKENLTKKYEAFAKTTPKLIAPHHQDQECIELNIHKTLMHAMNKNIAKIEVEAKKILSALYPDKEVHEE
ncbi:hypothetical protein K2W90_02415 [Candidatus Babeliales bacterium]|nr:hypothetical protein [Candidatus Babeliales bacterium]